VVDPGQHGRRAIGAAWSSASSKRGSHRECRIESDAVRQAQAFQASFAEQAERHVRALEKILLPELKQQQRALDAGIHLRHPGLEPGSRRVGADVSRSRISLRDSGMSAPARALT